MPTIVRENPFVRFEYDQDQRLLTGTVNEYDPPEVIHSVTPINGQHIAEDFQLSTIDEIVTRKTIRSESGNTYNPWDHTGGISNKNKMI